MQLVPYSIIEMFRPVSLYRKFMESKIIEKIQKVSVDKPEADHTDGVNDIVKQAHALIGGNDGNHIILKEIKDQPPDSGEFYTAADYGTAAVEALRYGHCILALNLSRKNNVFSELTEAILEWVASQKYDIFKNKTLFYRAATPFAEPSLVTMYKRSNTTHVTDFCIIPTVLMK